MSKYARFSSKFELKAANGVFKKYRISNTESASWTLDNKIGSKKCVLLEKTSIKNNVTLLSLYVQEISHFILGKHGSLLIIGIA